MTTLEQRIQQLEEEVKRLKQCTHEYKRVGGRNTNLKVYHNGSNSYIECMKCGKRQKV
jgi:hypothetical protein